MHNLRVSTIALGACLCLVLAALPALAQAPLRVGDELRIHVDSLGGSDMEITPTGDGRMFMMPWPAREEGKEDETTYEVTSDDSPF